jgi:16S rRNA (cytidine1402-2'-O)-methyltransferase
MKDVITTLGNERIIVMGRELTKQFETIKKLSTGELFEFIIQDSNQQRGEFVLLILPNPVLADDSERLSTEQINILQLIAAELPAKKAVNLTHKLVGGNKDLLYNFLLAQKGTSSADA